MSSNIWTELIYYITITGEFGILQGSINNDLMALSIITISSQFGIILSADILSGGY